MDAGPATLPAIVGTGLALAALFMIQATAPRREFAALRNEVGELRHEVDNLRRCVVRLGGTIDSIQMGMQLPQPTKEAETD